MYVLQCYCPKSLTVFFNIKVSLHVSCDFVPFYNSVHNFLLVGDRDAECRVKIVNDRQHEKEESFRLVLGTPDGVMPGGATLGGQITTKIVIRDPEDSVYLSNES